MKELFMHGDDAKPDVFITYSADFGTDSFTLCGGIQKHVEDVGVENIQAVIQA